MTGESLVKQLLKLDWRLKSVRGSHHKMVNPHTGEIVTVPCHKKDLGKGLLEEILKQTGLK